MDLVEGVTTDFRVQHPASDERSLFAALVRSHCLSGRCGAYRVKLALSLGVAIPQTRSDSSRSLHASTIRREGTFDAETSS